MRSASDTWAVVLAAGDGTRLRELTTTPSGETIPKQFCSLHRETCLLEDAIRRAHTVSLPKNVCSVVAARHRHWWRGPLKGLPTQNIFVQPKNRGTACGILFGLLQVEARAPNAVVVLLPADHYLSDEAIMARSLRMAANLASDNRELIYLLGVEPEGPDQELGYIVPCQRRGEAAGVSRFVEKPTSECARQLLKDGALWNTFIFAGSVRAILRLFEDRLSSTVADLRAALETSKGPSAGFALEALYADLHVSDFCRDVLENHANVLQVVRVPNCGWTDLGTPERVEAAVRNLERKSSNAAINPSADAHYWDLGSQVGDLAKLAARRSLDRRAVPQPKLA